MMFEPHFWRRFLRIGLYSLVAYTIMGYVVIGAAILHWEVRLLPLHQPVTTSVTQNGERSGVVASRVHNVFGDPIPFAVIHINGRIVQADSTGHFAMENLHPHRTKLEILAGGYRRYQWDIHIEEGMNTPIIKYDTGLWPAFFLIDFHVFHHGGDRIYGVLGLANGSDEALYIHRAAVFDPQGTPIMEVFEQGSGYAYFSELSGHVEVVGEPQKALRFPANTWLVGDLPPITAPLLNGQYSLEVHFGTAREHEQGHYQVLRRQDTLDGSSSWNPHLP